MAFWLALIFFVGCLASVWWILLVDHGDLKEEDDPAGEDFDNPLAGADGVSVHGSSSSSSACNLCALLPLDMCGSLCRLVLYKVLLVSVVRETLMMLPHNLFLLRMLMFPEWPLPPASIFFACGTDTVNYTR